MGNERASATTAGKEGVTCSKQIRFAAVLFETEKSIKAGKNLVSAVGVSRNGPEVGEGRV